MNIRSITMYALAALMVVIVGGLAGWYFFLRTQTQTTAAEDAARGFGASTPFGGAGGSTAANASASGAGASASRPPQLWQVDKNPVAGMAFTASATSTQLEYAERSNGYVFTADPATSAIVRLTNTLMPKIYEALITPDGRVIERGLDDAGAITTFVGSVSTSTPGDSSATSSAPALSGLYLAKNIARIAVDPNSGGIFSLAENAAGDMVGTRSLADGTKPKTAFTSVIMGWRPTWLSDGRIILAQTAADNVPGYAYQLNSDGSLSPLLRDIPGLTVLPRAGGAILYGASGNDTLALFVQLPNTTAVQLPIKTVADKCAWFSGSGSASSSAAALVAYCGVPQALPAADFLNNWYQGALHTADAIWEVDASAGNAKLLYTPDIKTPIDVEHPTVDASGNYLAFINGADQSLWILRINK